MKSLFKGIKIFSLIFVAVTLTLLTVVGLLGGVFSSDRYWVLAGGEIVHFTREEHPGVEYARDDIKVLSIEYADGRKERYTFGETHAGYNAVELWGDSDHSMIMLIDRIQDELLLGIAVDIKARKVLYDESDFCSEPEKHCLFHYDHIEKLLDGKTMIAPSNR